LEMSLGLDLVPRIALSILMNALTVPLASQHTVVKMLPKPLTLVLDALLMIKSAADNSMLLPMVAFVHVRLGIFPTSQVKARFTFLLVLKCSEDVLMLVIVIVMVVSPR